MMRKTSLLILFGFLCFHAQSQMIKEIPFEKENSVFKLVYDLPEFASSYEVILTSNYPTGRGFVKVTENALGDVGENIPSGKNKTIYWQPEKGVDFNEAILEFKIVMIPLASANNSNEGSEESANNTEEIIRIPESVIAKHKEEITEETPSSTEIPEPESASTPEQPTTNAMSGAGAEIPGRTVRSKPDSPKNPGVNGVVVVRVCVDTKGNVVRAQFIENGSNLTDSRAIAASVANAKNWKFNENSMAAYKECGVIKFYFKMK